MLSILHCFTSARAKHLMMRKINWSMLSTPLTRSKHSKPRALGGIGGPQLPCYLSYHLLFWPEYLRQCHNLLTTHRCNQPRLRSLWRAWQGPKRKADDISRTQYEIYLFLTKHNLFGAAVDELLEMLSNVCTSFDQSRRKAGPATCEFDWSSEYDLYCKLLLPIMYYYYIIFLLDLL